MYKFIFFVPVEDAEEVKKAVFKSGAGTIGNYRECSFESHGTGQFLPVEGSNPHLGAHNKLERVSELKVEIMCEEGQVAEALEAMRLAHPYEEPAWEVIKLENQRFLNIIAD